MPTTTETWYANADWRSFQRTEYPYQYAEDVVIRYIDLTDPRDLEAKVTYLSGLTGITALKVNGETVVGTWNTHFARYEPVNPNDDRNYIIRLYHALIPAGLATGDGVYVTENNCTYKVSLTFYWRQAALMNPVTAGTSGVTYRITGINRDRFTGLYDYILEQREQITTYVAEHVVGDTQFDTTYEQKFIGVRKTTEGGNTYTKDNAGNAIAALYTMANAQGTTYTQDISKNENCTADITQRKTVAKTNVEMSVERTRTAFSDTETKVTRNATVAVNAYVAITGGVITVQSSKLNDDGTFDNTKQTKTAIASDAVVTRERTAFSEFVSITRRNQAAAVDAFVNVTGGIITRRTSNKNADGTYDNTEETRTAIALEAVVTRSQTIFSQIVGITLRNQTTAVNAFVAVANGIITTRTSRRNDDGTFDNTEETRTALSTTFSVESSRTLYDDSVTTTIRNAATAVNALVEVSGGVVTIRKSQKNDDATYDNSETLKTERAVSSAEVVKAKGLFFDRTVVTNRSQVAAAADPSAYGVTVTNKKTDGAAFDQGTETKTPNAVANAVKLQTGDFTESSTRTDNANQASADSTTPGLTDSGKNDRVTVPNVIAKITTVVNRKTDEGKVDTSKTIDLPEPSWSQAFTFTSSDGDTVKMYLFNNMTQTVLQAAFTAIGAINGISPMMRVNKFGLYDGSITFKYNADADVEWTAWSKTITRRRRLANGQSLEYSGTAAFGFNVSDGASTFYTGTHYEGSWFRSVGRNWYMYEKLTSVTPVS